MSAISPAVITGAAALDALYPAVSVREVRVSRKCPACFARGQHRGNADGVKHQIVCINCGHSWTGVVKNAELS